MTQIAWGEGREGRRQKNNGTVLAATVADGPLMASQKNDEEKWFFLPWRVYRQISAEYIRYVGKTRGGNHYDLSTLMAAWNVHLEGRDKFCPSSGQPMLNNYIFSNIETLRNVWFKMPKVFEFLIAERYFHRLENLLQIPQKHFLMHQLSLNFFEHILLWERGFEKIFFSYEAQGGSRRNVWTQSPASHRKTEWGKK